MTESEWAEIAAFLARTVAKDMPESQVGAYFDLLQDLPADAVRLAAKQALLESQFPSIPPVGVLRRLAVTLASPALPDAAEAWRLVREAIGLWGFDHGARAGACLPPLVREAVETVGWCWLCHLTEEATRPVFLKVYQVLLVRECRFSLLTPDLRERLAGAEEGQPPHRP